MNERERWLAAGTFIGGSAVNLLDVTWPTDKGLGTALLACVGLLIALYHLTQRPTGEGE